MRLSDWRLVWNPLGTAPVILAEFDDLLEDELLMPLDQLVDTGTFDFAASATLAARGNLKRRMEYATRIQRESAAASYHACQAALLADPWGVKAELSIQARGGVPKLYSGALLSSSHTPAHDGPIMESLHRYAWRVAPRFLTLGDAISVGGGYYQDPNIIIITPPPGGWGDITTGDTVLVTGVPGVRDGYYTVTGTPGGNLSMIAPTSDATAARAEVYDAGSWMCNSNEGAAQMTFAGTRIQFSGLTGGGEYRLGTTWGSSPTVNPDGSGNYLMTLSPSHYHAFRQWYPDYETPRVNPLTVDGQSVPNGWTGQTCIQTPAAGFTYILWHDGTVVDQVSITPRWSARAYYSVTGSPYLYGTAPGLAVNLKGHGARTVPLLANTIPCVEPGGTVQRVTHSATPP